MGPLVLSAIGTITGIVVGAVLTFALARQNVRATAKKDDTDTSRVLLSQRVDELRAERDKADTKVATLETELRAAADDCKAQIMGQDARIVLLEADALAKAAAFEGVLAAIKVKDDELAALKARNTVLADRQADLLFEARLKAAQAPPPAAPASAPAPAAPPTAVSTSALPPTQVVLQVTSDVLTAAPDTPMVVKTPADGRR